MGSFFNRDVNCVRKFFRKRFRYEAASWPTWRDVLTIDEEDEEEEGVEGDKVEEGEDAKPKTGRRLDLEVEASGFGSAMQTELEDVSLFLHPRDIKLTVQYMNEVQDMPQSDDEDEEEDEEEEQEEEEEPTTIPDESKEPEEFDEEAFQKQMSDRLEAMRLNKALGNDDPDDLEEEEVDSESESESEDSDSESGDSVGPAMTEFSSFDQNRKKKPARVPRTKGLTRADELKLTVAQQVGKERESKEKRFHSKKSVNKAGNAKGHKWKQSDAFQVGKNSGW
jgi:RIO kinase 2